MLVSVHDGYGTEPPTWYRATESHASRHSMTLPLGWMQPRKKHTQPYPGQWTIWLAFMTLTGEKPLCMRSETKSGSMGRYHHSSSDEKVRPQVARPVPCGKGHLPERIPTQVAIIIRPNTPSILGHSVTTLQCGRDN